MKLLEKIEKMEKRIMVSTKDAVCFFCNRKANDSFVRAFNPENNEPIVCHTFCFHERVRSYNSGHKMTQIGSLSQCDYCKKVYKSNRNESCHRCGRYICDECNEDHPSICLLHDVEFYGPTPTTPSLTAEPGEFITSERMAGVELEVIDPTTTSRFMDLRRKFLRISLDEEHIDCGIDYDGSVNGEMGNGFEVVLKPANKKEFEERLSKACKILKSQKYSINETCGVHVHVDARDIKKNGQKLAHLLRTFYAIEDIVFSLTPPSRWDNRFCQSLSANYVFDDFKNSMSADDFENYWYNIGERRGRISRDDIRSFKGSKRNYTKYSGINFHATMYRGTIEFRHHAGSLNAKKIMGWAGFMQAIIDYSVDRYKDVEVVELFEMKTGVEKLDKVIQVLGISESIAEYMRGRVDKFNKGFKLFQRDMRKASNNRKKIIKGESSYRQEFGMFSTGEVRRLRTQPLRSSTRHAWVVADDPRPEPLDESDLVRAMRSEYNSSIPTMTVGQSQPEVTEQIAAEAHERMRQFVLEREGMINQLGESEIEAQPNRVWRQGLNAFLNPEASEEVND